MNFTSYSFIAFFAVVLAVYNAAPQRYRIAVLVFAGYFFCFYASWVSALVLALVTLAAFLCAKAIEQSPGRRLVFWSVLAVLFPLLAAKCFISAFKGDDAVMRLAFPLGLSFYSLQAVGYVLDVHWRRVPAERSFLRVALYLAFFPILQSGPIERAGNLLPQLSSLGSTSATTAFLAGKQILWGLFCKLVIADKLAIIVADVFSKVDERGGAVLIVGLCIFALQLYFDFYGYTTIAIAVALLFGVRIGPNFNHPYLAASFRDFWHRWHISLSTWLRDYIYVPMGGRQRPKLVHALLVMLVFAISGIWHGLSQNYLAWGMAHSLLYLGGIWTARVRTSLWHVILRGRLKRVQHAIQSIVLFTLVSITWLFFLVHTWEEAVSILRRIVSTKLITDMPAVAELFARADYRLFVLWTLVFFVADSLGAIRIALESVPKGRSEIIRELVIVDCLAILLVLTGDIGAKGFIYMYFYTERLK
jgi:D-alanyl-lipoteichoic acid acyltransferase DltB (MBOAT superfamily)